MWDVLDKQVCSMDDPPHYLLDLKDLLLTCSRKKALEMFGNEVSNLKWLPLCTSPLRVEKQNVSWVTGISMFPEKALGKAGNTGSIRQPQSCLQTRIRSRGIVQGQSNCITGKKLNQNPYLQESSGEHWREKRSTPPHSSTPLPSFTEKPLSRDLSPSWMDHQSRKTLFLLIALDGN
ncbi:hypothetical protein ATANTOWER_024160 [Ataeniobius toweri]|uniref:Uncharacterized protein n=1 Tax=Ataeniobius toweri TaxID=208326 RepID=A0ABU7BXN7_9TELE|nr:hypothetical protein [Ataeniobius toweri]